MGESFVGASTIRSRCVLGEYFVGVLTWCSEFFKVRDLLGWLCFASSILMVRVLLGVMDVVISRLVVSPNKFLTFCHRSTQEPPTKVSPEGATEARTRLFYPTKFSPFGRQITRLTMADPNNVLT